MCFTDSGGTLTIGSALPELHQEPMRYVPLLPSRNGWYLVKVSGVSLGRKDISTTASTALIDSGTTDTYLLRSFGEAFLAHFSETTGLAYEAGKTYHLSLQKLMSLPSLTFRLEGGAVLILRPDKYMEPEGHDAYVPRVYFSELGYSILGANALNGYDVAFDLTNNRVGLARAHCEFDGANANSPCDCPEPTEGSDLSPVCGMDGSTFMSPCYAKCMNKAIAWEGACPSHLPARCRSVLFSKDSACFDLATTFIQGNGR